MPHFRIILVVVLITWTLLPAPAAAQGGGGEQLIERLVAEIEITDQVLQRAWEVVRSSDDETAKTIVRLASERQEWARAQVTELRRQFRLRLHTSAMNATQKAREQARGAIAAVNRANSHEGMVVRRLERTEQLLDRARQIGQDHADRERLRGLYDAARRNLDRAWEFHRRAEYRPALKLANQAAATANRLLRALRADRTGSEEFERRQAGLNQKIDAAREQLTCESVLSLLDDAEKAYFDALEQAEQDQYENAYHLLQKGNELVGQAAKNCKGLENIDRGIEQLQNQLQELVDRRGELNGAELDSFDTMTGQAKEQIDLARKYAGDKKYDPAKISIQAAMSALGQARRILEQY